MEKITVERSKSKLTTFILVGAAFVGIGIWFLLVEGFKDFLAWFVLPSILFFGAATFYYVKELLSDKPLITLDENGVELPYYGQIPWSDIKDISDFGQLLYFYVENEKMYVARLPLFLRVFARANKLWGVSSVYVPTAYCQGDQKNALVDSIVKKVRFTDQKS